MFKYLLHITNNMRKEYTTISISKDLSKEIEELRKNDPFYLSNGEFVRRAIMFFLEEYENK